MSDFRQTYNVGKCFCVIWYSFRLTRTFSPADIIRDFESQTLQEEWNRFGKSVMQQRNVRIRSTQEAVAANQQKMMQAREARQKRTESLDHHLEHLKASFVDGAKALDYDSSKLIERYGGWTTKEVDDPTKPSKPLPCLGPRAHWIDCQKKYGAVDSRPCNFYIEALEECVHQTITGTAPGKD